MAKLKLLICVQKKAYASEFRCIASASVLCKTSLIPMLGPFVGYDGLLRLGGRLHFSHLSFEEKHPVILP